jgi:hypothetical protein
MVNILRAILIKQELLMYVVSFEVGYLLRLHVHVILTNCITSLCTKSPLMQKVLPEIII